MSGTNCPDPDQNIFKSRFSLPRHRTNQDLLMQMDKALNQTPIIQRGFKPELGSNRQNGGNGSDSEQSGGGSGCVGGSIGDNGQGGGGGSGYTNGEATVVTRQGVGTNGSNAFARFENLID